MALIVIITSCNRKSNDEDISHNDLKKEDVYDKNMTGLPFDEGEIDIVTWFSWLKKHMHTPAFPNHDFRHQTVILFASDIDKSKLLVFPEQDKISYNEYISAGLKAYDLERLDYGNGLIFLVDKKNSVKF